MMMTTYLGEKQLAAIVFSDVVGFSERMGLDEPGTLRAVGADLEHMGAVAGQQFGGKVIKSTGDGLLLRFGSAADAVSFALQVQRAFADRLKADPGAVVHRIGVHLGDVFLRDDDVMGDGVNIAARLQHEAEPGGICISQTVFDVIRGKVSAEAVSIGPRELKNIRQSIHAYQLVIGASADPAGMAGGMSIRRAPGPTESRNAGPVIVGAFVLMLAVGGVFLATDWLRLRKAGTVGGVVGKNSAAGSAPASTGPATPPAVAEVPGLGRHAKVYIGPLGVRIVAVPLGAAAEHRALVQVNGCDDPAWDGRIVEHEVRPDGEQINYVRLNDDGAEWFTLNGRDIGLPSERWLAAVPGAQQVQDFEFSDAESQKWDRMAFMAAYWNQRDKEHAPIQGH